MYKYYHQNHCSIPLHSTCALYHCTVAVHTTIALTIWRKGQSTSHDYSPNLSLKKEGKKSSLNILIPLPFFFRETEVWWIITVGIELITNSPLSLNWQQICSFLWINSHLAFFFKCTNKCIFRFSAVIQTQYSHLDSALIHRSDFTQLIRLTEANLFLFTI